MTRHLRFTVAALALTLAGGCHEKSVERVETTAAVPVVTETAKVDTFVDKIVVGGVVSAAPGGSLTVVAPEASRIAEIPVAEGDAVKEGALLVRFDIPTLASDLSAKRAAVAQATARLEASRANLTRLSGLLAQGVAAQREVEEAKRTQAEAEADLDQAKSAVEAALSLSARTTVHAPFAGVVAKRFHNPGDFADASTSDPILTIIDPTKVQIVASVPVADLPRVVVGHAADVHAAGQDEGQAAHVLTKPAQVDPDGATGDVRLAFAKPTTFPAGMRVNIEIVGTEHKQALIIPAAAIVTEEGEIFVMVAGPDNKAHKYPVAIGLSTRTQVEITSGLKAGDRVIVRGQDGLPEGAAVVVEER